MRLLTSCMLAVCYGVVVVIAHHWAAQSPYLVAAVGLAVAAVAAVGSIRSRRPASSPANRTDGDR